MLKTKNKKKIYKIGKNSCNKKGIKNRYGTYYVDFKIIRFIKVENMSELEKIILANAKEYIVKGEMVSCNIKKIDKIIKKSKKELTNNFDKKGKYKCNLCNKSFVLKTDHARHMQRKIPCDGRPVELGTVEDKLDKIDKRMEKSEKSNERIEKDVKRIEKDIKIIKELLIKFIKKQDAIKT
jgi:transposase-like protein